LGATAPILIGAWADAVPTGRALESAAAAASAKTDLRFIVALLQGICAAGDYAARMPNESKDFRMPLSTWWNAP
jgi:hypothetical protein